MKSSGRGSHQFALLACVLLLSTSAAIGQTTSLALSSASVSAGGTATLSLALTSVAGNSLAGLQWTFSYPSASVTSFSVTPSSAVTAAAKSLLCASGTNSYTCLVTGLNTNTIPGGSIAAVTVTLAPSTSSISIGVSGALGATSAGAAVPISATGGSIIVPAPVTLTSVGCASNSLPSGATTTCTVSLSGAATTSALVVGLSSSVAGLVVPASVTIPVNASSATFTASAGTISSDQTATLTASLNGTSTSTNLSLLAPVLVSSLACNPASVGPNASTTCTVTLTKAAPAGGAIVTLTNTNATLTVPASITVPAGATSAPFSATTGAIGSDQSATITATYNGSSANTSVSLAASVLVSSLACNPSSLGPNSSTTCTVTLTKAAPAGGAIVTLTNTNATLTVPASVTVPAAATSAPFSATTAAIGSDQSATITATYNGSSANTSVSLAASVLVSSLACNPSSVGPNSSTTCTVTLTKAAPAGGAIITLTNTNTTLTVPASVTVAAAATSAPFSATTAAIASDQSASIIASLNGSSTLVTLSLTGGTATLSTLTCAAIVVPGASGTCTVTLAAPSPAATVSLTSSNVNLQLPTSLTIPAGAVSGTAAFTTTPTLSGWAIIVATLGSVQKSAIITAQPPPLITVTSCTTAGTSGTCTVALALPAPAGGTTARVQSSSNVLRAPASVTVPEGRTDAAFPIETSVPYHDEVVMLRVSTSNASAVISVPVRGLRPVSLTCREKLVASGESTLCEVLLDDRAPTDQVELAISSSSAGLKVPPSVVPRRGQSRVLFEVAVDPLAHQETAELAVGLGGNVVRQSVLIQPAKSPALYAPATEAVVAGTAVGFSVASTDAADLPVNVVALDLPVGASFDATTNSFAWTPSDRQKGIHTITFTAKNSVGSTTSGTTTIEVGPETPVLTDLVNSATGSAGPACVPGAMATLRGKWLSEGAGSPSITSGNQPDAAETRVRINGTYAAVLYSSPHSVDFICPAVAPGTPLQIVLETGIGTSNLIQTTMQEAAPGVIMRDTPLRSPALMHFSSGSGMVGIPNYNHASQVVLPGDSVTLWATGVNCTEKNHVPSVSIRIGGTQVTVDSVDAVPERPGFCRVNVTLPETQASGEAVPVTLDLAGSNGQVFSSNTTSIAVGQHF